MNLNDLVKYKRPEKTRVNLTTRRAGEDILGGEFGERKGEFTQSDRFLAMVCISQLCLILSHTIVEVKTALGDHR